MLQPQKTIFLSIQWRFASVWGGLRMRRDDDKKAIGRWLECYNKLNGANYWVDSYPDELARSC
jgi:hypothetical protein